MPKDFSPHFKFTKTDDPDFPHRLQIIDSWGRSFPGFIELSFADLVELHNATGVEIALEEQNDAGDI